VNHNKRFAPQKVLWRNMLAYPTETYPISLLSRGQHGTWWSWTCPVGCIKQTFSSVSTIKSNQKLPFAMGFKNSAKFFKDFNVLNSPKRAKLLKIGIFHEIGLFCVEYFYNQLIACSVIYSYWKDLLKLRRMVYNL